MNTIVWITSNQLLLDAMCFPVVVLFGTRTCESRMNVGRESNRCRNRVIFTQYDSYGKSKYNTTLCLTWGRSLVNQHQSPFFVPRPKGVLVERSCRCEFWVPWLVSRLLSRVYYDIKIVTSKAIVLGLSWGWSGSD